MKRLVTKGLVCPHCGTGGHLSPKHMFVKCKCGKCALYGKADSPVMCYAQPPKPALIDVIIMVADDFVPTEKPELKVAMINPKTRSIFGVPQKTLDYVLPLLAFKEHMRWDDRDLIAAAKALLDYERLLGNEVV